MSRTAVLFLAVVLVAALFGFSGYAGALGNMVWWICAALIVVGVVIVLAGRPRR